MCVSWSMRNLGWKLTPEQESKFVEALVTALDKLILRVYGEHKYLKWGFELTAWAYKGAWRTASSLELP